MDVELIREIIDSCNTIHTIILVKVSYIYYLTLIIYFKETKNGNENFGRIHVCICIIYPPVH